MRRVQQFIFHLTVHLCTGCLVSSCSQCTPRDHGGTPIHRRPLAAEESERLPELHVKAGEDLAALTYSITEGGKLKVHGAKFQRQLTLVDDRPRNGLLLAEVSDEVRPLIFGPEAPDSRLLVLDTLLGGPAFYSAVRIGDLLRQVDGVDVSNAKGYRQVIQDAAEDGVVELQLWRRGEFAETVIMPVEDATETTEVNFINLYASSKSPEKSKLSLLWELLYSSRTCNSLVPDASGKEIEPLVEQSWHAFFGFLYYEDTQNRTEFRFLWFLPVVWKTKQRIH